MEAMSQATEFCPRRAKISAAAELAGGISWKDDLQAYERTRRHEVQPGLVAGPPMRLDPVKVKLQERAYDPLLGRFRDDKREAEQRDFESHERVKHLNRAKDIQILRESNYDITNHRSRLASAIGGEHQHELTFGDPNTTAMPHTTVDYNIISNIPFDNHHWAHPELRPPAPQKQPRTRQVVATGLKDFNIISNRYVQDHDSKTDRDRALNTIEATSKFRTRCRFDPVTQTFNCPREEARHRSHDDADEQAFALRAKVGQPPSYSGRQTAFYDPISHKAHDQEMLDVYDAAQDARKHRYRRGHEVQRELQQKDILFEDCAVIQKSEQIAHERFEETARRGYDIITNRGYGNRPREQKLHQPYTIPRLTPWEKVLIDRDEPPAANAAVAEAHASTQIPSSSSGALSARTSRNVGSVGRQDVAADSRSAVASSGCSAASRSGAMSATGPLPRRTVQSASTPPAQLKTAGAQAVGTPRPPMPPPPPAIPGSPVGSVYSRPKAS